MDAKCPNCGKIYHNHNPKNLYTRCWSCYKYFYLPDHLIDNNKQEDKAMVTQLDIDDVAATSELAKKQLDSLRAENENFRELMEWFCKRVEIGEVRSARTYKAFKEALWGREMSCNQ